MSLCESNVKCHKILKLDCLNSFVFITVNANKEQLKAEERAPGLSEDLLTSATAFITRMEKSEVLVFYCLTEHRLYNDAILFGHKQWDVFYNSNNYYL